MRGPELSTWTLDIVGFGRIGRRVAKRAEDGFNMDVLAYDSFVDHVEMELFGVEKVADLQDMYRPSDVISLHADVNPTSRNLFGPAEFEAMSDHAYFVNAARAATLEEGALVEALRNDEIRGVAMDVYHQEPIAEDDPLLRMDNVVTMPYIASASMDITERYTDLTVRDIAAVLSDKDPMQVKIPRLCKASPWNPEPAMRPIPH